MKIILIFVIFFPLVYTGLFSFLTDIADGFKGVFSTFDQTISRNTFSEAGSNEMLRAETLARDGKEATNGLEQSKEIPTANVKEPPVISERLTMRQGEHVPQLSGSARDSMQTPHEQSTAVEQVKKSNVDAESQALESAPKSWKEVIKEKLHLYGGIIMGLSFAVVAIYSFVKAKMDADHQQEVDKKLSEQQTTSTPPAPQSAEGRA